MQAIPYFLKDTTNSWYQSLINKPQDFNAFKVEFLKYFSNNNSINRLVNAFTIIKQGETEAVTTYLGCFHRNLCQIQAIDANYFTASQILNQFICSLYSSILQHVHLLHPGNLQNAVIRARDFESAESETNHVQAINLVINGSSELNSKLKQFTIATGNISTAAANNLLTSNDSDTAMKLTCQWSPKTENHAAKLEIGSCQWNSGTSYPQNLNSQDYLSLLVTPEDTSPSNQDPIQKQQTLTSNILPATVTNDKSLAVIFPLEIKEPSNTPLFSGATLDEKPITVIYTNAKVDGQSIKLILDSGSADSIITRQLMDQLANGTTKTPIGKIDAFPIKVNGITVPIKVLVMEATQYQGLVGNDWLSKTKTVLDWTTQELQLTFNNQYTCVPATCGYFKTPSEEEPLIELEEEEKKPIWEAY
ncbi:hypothetical protein G9A89_007806 [Geosiphon pyriformis]|nr:hypothetical protein G9A89_007806 [Geosiphon pyriformis]